MILLLTETDWHSIQGLSTIILCFAFLFFLIWVASR